MDLTFLIFSIIIVICVVVMYYYFSYNRTTLYGNQVLLNDAQKTITIPAITNNPNSEQYTISLWVFLISWNTNGNCNTILNMKSSKTNQTSSSVSVYNVKDDSPKAYENYILYLDSTSPKLYFYVPSKSATCAISGDILLTNNFPVQSWVFIAISVNGNVGDFYLNGKLVTSKNISDTSSYLKPGGTIELGNPSTSSGIDPVPTEFNPNMYVAYVQRQPVASSPQDVWVNYLAGNHVSATNVNSYGAQLGLKQNGEILTTFNIN